MMRLREWEWSSGFRHDHNSSINCCSQPKNMSMPPQCASLACHVEVISVAMTSLDRTLCYICRSISPAISELLQPMPANNAGKNITDMWTRHDISYFLFFCSSDNLPVNGHVILGMVGDIYKNSITFSNINGRSWESTINCDNRLRMAQPADILYLNLHREK